MNPGVDPRHADQMVRGVVAMPNGTGKSMRVAVFAKDAKVDEAKAAGADFVGAEDWLRPFKMVRLALIVLLHPRYDGCCRPPWQSVRATGLMPNPKLGTVTVDVEGAVNAAKAGEVQYRAEKVGVVTGIGKASFDEAKIVENAAAFIDAVRKARPTGAKGQYIKRLLFHQQWVLECSLRMRQSVRPNNKIF